MKVSFIVSLLLFVGNSLAILSYFKPYSFANNFELAPLFIREYNSDNVTVDELDLRGLSYVRHDERFTLNYSRYVSNYHVIFDFEDSPTRTGLSINLYKWPVKSYENKLVFNLSMPFVYPDSDNCAFGVDFETQLFTKTCWMENSYNAKKIISLIMNVCEFNTTSTLSTCHEVPNNQILFEKDFVILTIPTYPLNNSNTFIRLNHISIHDASYPGEYPKSCVCEDCFSSTNVVKNSATKLFDVFHITGTIILLIFLVF